MIKKWHNIQPTNRQRTPLFCVWHPVGEQHWDLTSLTVIHFWPMVEVTYVKRGLTSHGNTDFHWLNNLCVSMLGRSPCQGFGGELDTKLGAGSIYIGISSQSWCSLTGGGVSSTSHTFINLKCMWYQSLVAGPAQLSPLELPLWTLELGVFQEFQLLSQCTYFLLLHEVFGNGGSFVFCVSPYWTCEDFANPTCVELLRMRSCHCIVVRASQVKRNFFKVWMT